MLKEEPRTTDFSVVDRMLTAIEQGDLDGLRRCFAPDARFWHNNDGIEQDIDQVISLLGLLCSVSTRRSYEDRRAATIGSTAFLQHVLTATLQSGQEVRIPTSMRVEVGSHGLVERIEEYFDSRAVDLLFEVVR